MYIFSLPESCLALSMTIRLRYLHLKGEGSGGGRMKIIGDITDFVSPRRTRSIAHRPATPASCLLALKGRNITAQGKRSAALGMDRHMKPGPP